jgi:hypothetical protein
MLRSSEAVNLDAFPSMKAMAYTVFYKFYTDRDRRPSSSDAFDVLISGALPYVEAVITENHQAEAIRKAQHRTPFYRTSKYSRFGTSAIDRLCAPRLAAALPSRTTMTRNRVRRGTGKAATPHARAGSKAMRRSCESREPATRKLRATLNVHL